MTVGEKTQDLSVFGSAVLGILIASSYSFLYAIMWLLQAGAGVTTSEFPGGKGHRDGQDFLLNISLYGVWVRRAAWLPYNTAGEENMAKAWVERQERLSVTFLLLPQPLRNYTKPSIHPLTPAPLLINTFVITELDCSIFPKLLKFVKGESRLIISW